MGYCWVINSEVLRRKIAIKLVELIFMDLINLIMAIFWPKSGQIIQILSKTINRIIYNPLVLISEEFGWPGRCPLGNYGTARISIKPALNSSKITWITGMGIVADGG